jgi:hypothetical protein
MMHPTNRAIAAALGCIISTEPLIRDQWLTAKNTTVSSTGLAISTLSVGCGALGGPHAFVVISIG